MMAFVYLFEYVIYVGLAAISNTNLNATKQENIYIYLNACYQIGVFLSRSSVSLFSTKRFGLITFLIYKCYNLAFPMLYIIL